MTKLLHQHQKVALVESMPVFGMAQKKDITYLLPLTHIASHHFASHLGDRHSSLEHLVSTEEVAYDAGSVPNCPVGTSNCLEEFHQEAQDNTDL